MRHSTAPCSGYVVKVTPQILNSLGLTFDFLMKQCWDEPAEGWGIKTAEELIAYAARNNEEIQIKIGEKLINIYPFVYNADNGGCYDELEGDETYLTFEEDDLYVKTETSVLQKLQSMNCVPELRAWTVWG